MKHKSFFEVKSFKKAASFLLVMFFVNMQCVFAAVNYKEYKGKIVDKNTGNPLAYASISVQESNVNTVTNTDGEFSLKVPSDNTNARIVISFIGYRNKLVKLSEFTENMEIELQPISIELPEVSVISKDAESLVEAMMQKKITNYGKEDFLMTAFYRETIRKNKSYVSLSEAVVDIYKESYDSYKSDVVQLYKSRKKTDYEKLDTLVFKLMGGPFNSLYLDLMKNPDMIFTDEMMKNYIFKFDHSTKMDNRLIYVVDFVQSLNNIEPLYYGKLYIDAESLALKSAVFKLNLSDKEAASRMFIVKKPFNANVYPVEASYRINYNEKNGNWFYGYSRIELGLRVNWKRKVFNTTYYSTIEMATTNRAKAGDTKPAGYYDRLKTNVIIENEATGFSDPDFWGDFNVIEPEKPIESAIKKIQKQLEKKD